MRSSFRFHTYAACLLFAGMSPCAGPFTPAVLAAEDYTYTAPSACCHAYGTLLDDHTIGEWHDTIYWSAGAAGREEGILHIDDWIGGCAPSMPTHVPYRDPQVRVEKILRSDEEGKGHYGIDYARPDGKTFAVHAAAAGRVLFVGYHPSPGHVVILEHRPPHAAPFRTIYHHLRNGRDRDIRLAAETRAFVEASEGRWQYDDAAQAWQEAGEVAIAADPSKTGWIEKQFGTNDQRLLVKEGDFVAAGQQIGWAGNTGMHSGGTHLHFMIARIAHFGQSEWYAADGQRPFPRWTLYDPYGLYLSESQIHRYNRDDGDRDVGQHPSVFTPYFEEFIDLTQQQYDEACDYYAGIHYFPTVVEAKVDGQQPLFSGVFNYDRDMPVVRTLRTVAEHAGDVEEWLERNWEPSSIDVVHDKAGNPLLSTVYADVALPHEAHHKMTIKGFRHRFTELYTQGFMLTSLSVYPEDGKLWMAGGWTRPKEFYSYYVEYTLTKEEFEEKDAQYSEKGAPLWYITKYRDLDDTVRYGGIWRQLPKKQVAIHAIDLSAERFRSVVDAHKADGWRVHHVSTFEGTHAAIFTRGERPFELLPSLSYIEKLTRKQLVKRSGVEEPLPVKGEYTGRTSKIGF